MAESIQITSPNGGERYVAGKPLTITYTVSEQFPITTVNLQFSTDALYWYPVEYWVPAAGTYEWVAHSEESNNYYLRISSDDFACSDTSDNPFTIFQCAAPIPGDVNEDCYVDLQDVAMLAQNWLLCGNGFDPACTAF